MDIIKITWYGAVSSTADFCSTTETINFRFDTGSFPWSLSLSQRQTGRFIEIYVLRSHLAMMIIQLCFCEYMIKIMTIIIRTDLIKN